MNETRVEELGITPLKAELAAIDALKTKSDVARHFAHFFKLNLINPMIGYVDGDAQQPTHDILYVYQGGLGLPDRDYYLQNDPKLKEYREKYVAFLTTLLKFVNDPAPEKSAAAIFALETRLARAHWTNVENRDAVKTYNKVTVADLAKQFPGFDWSGVDHRARRQRHSVGRRESANAMSRPGGDRERNAGGELEAVSEGVIAQRLRAVSQQGRRRCGIRLLQHDVARREGTAAAVEARDQYAERQHGRDARQALCRTAFQARSQGAHGGPGRQPA